jgi:hypothetical protein
MKLVYHTGMTSKSMPNSLAARDDQMSTEPQPGHPNLLLIKVSFLREPHLAFFISSNSGGVWISNWEEKWESGIQCATVGDGPAAAQLKKLGSNGGAYMFVPFHQIKWMIANNNF